MKRRLLDLFCGAGGAAMGYHRAGFEVVGVDINRQPHYPFEFHQADAMTYPLDGFDAIHASPPCQQFSQLRRNMWAVNADKHPDLVDPIRQRLNAAGAPWVIENVPGAPLNGTLLLCGTMFGLAIRKHRLFEANWPMPLLAPFSCGDHGSVYNPWQGAGRTVAQHRAAMGTPWIPAEGGASRKGAIRTGADLAEAIPPAYTEWIGQALLAYLAEVMA